VSAFGAGIFIEEFLELGPFSSRIEYWAWVFILLN
jgi:hypothetical protein